MRRFLFIVMVFTLGHLLYAQESRDKITLSFDNYTRTEIFDYLADTTGYKFYYIDTWLNDELISRNYKDVLLEEILNDLLMETTLNYFILHEDKIILTKNNLIYPKLPEGFFGKDTNNLEKRIFKKTYVSPIFHNEVQSANDKELKTYRIGKEDLRNTQKTHRLSGVIKNLENGELLSNISIVLKNQNKGTTSNSNGFYELDLEPGINLLEFSALGFKSLEARVIIYNQGNLDIELKERIEQLDEVIVAASLYKNVENTSMGTEAINVEESKNIPLVLGERDVLKVATSLPGISTAGEASAGFNVRGGSSDQNLILLDDASIYNPQHFFGIFSALNPFSIGEIKIHKASIPASYGGRLSSVIDIKTKNGNSQKFSGEASIGPVTGNLLLEVPIMKESSSLLLGGRGAYANWILRSLDEESLNNSQASFYDVIASYSHKLNENTNIKATAYHSRDDFSITSDSLYIYANSLFSIKSNHRLNNKNNLSLLMTNSNYMFNIEYDRGADDSFIFDYSMNEATAKVKVDAVYNKKLKLGYGLESKLYTVQPGNIIPLNQTSIVRPRVISKERALESAGFIEGSYDISKKLAINVGVRYSLFHALGESAQRVYDDNIPKTEETVIDTLFYGKNDIVKRYDAPELRLSTRYLLSSDFSVKASYNNSIQYIHRLTNNTTISPIDTWKLSDLNIEPQRGQQISLGFFKNFNSNTYELSLEGYYKTINNVLDFKTGAQLLLNENIETEVLQGKGKAYGIEFLARKNNGRLNGWLGYTYSRSLIQLDSPFAEERVNNGAFFPSNFDKPHDFSLVANYKFTRRFSLSTNFVYQTGRPVTIPTGNFSFNDANYTVFSNRNSFRIPDFYRLDIGFNIEGNHKIKKFAHSFWTISVYNVLGRNNPFSVFFLTKDGNIKPYKSSIFTIPVPSITYNFKF